MKCLVTSQVPRELPIPTKIPVTIAVIKAECSPIEFNQGAWLVGAKIAGEYNKFEKIALGEAESDGIIEKYVKEQRAYISEIENVIC